MNSNISEQIQLLQQKYSLHSRLSHNSTSKPKPKSSSKTKTQISESKAGNYAERQLSSLSLPKNLKSLEESFDSKQRMRTFESERSMPIGKKYFDLSMHKAQTSFREVHKDAVCGIKLPKLNPTFESQVSKRVKERIKSEDMGLSWQGQILCSEEKIKSRALQKVNLIYANEQTIVENKYEKMMRIKKRLKLLERIQLKKDKIRRELGFAH